MVLGAAILIVPFNLDQIDSFFAQDTKRWYAEPIPTDFSPQSGLRGLLEWSAQINLPRQIYNDLGIHVNGQARLLLASSLMTPYPGRRVFQLEYYFGDDAIYAIDHTEPLHELIDSYRIKFVIVTGFRQDERVSQMEEYRAYQYGGRWSEPRPLRLGASYRFGPGEYSWPREVQFIHEFLTARGARMMVSEAGTLFYFL